MTSGYEMVKVRKVDGRREARWGGEGAWQVIDEETGLPRVGENQFWRVSPPVKDSAYMWIELRQRTPPKKKKTWWGKLAEIQQPSTVLGSTCVHVESSEFTSQSVFEATLYILRNIGEGMVKDDLIRKLAGDYPPKSLREAG